MDSLVIRQDEYRPQHIPSNHELNANESSFNTVDESDSYEDVVDHDRSVLKEEEEREKLLIRDTPVQRLQKAFGSTSDHGEQVRIGKKERRRQRRREKRRTKKKRRTRGGDEEGELMFEMEEGGFRDTGSEASTRSTSSTDLHAQNLGRPLKKKKARRSNFPRSCFVLCIVVVFFLIIFVGAYNASRGFRSKTSRNVFSNGTSLFGPTTILISLDGFRADFLDRGLTPTLNNFIAEGVSPQYMLPSFPSVTFPNHFTMVTGMYPESHGVVGNTFWDPGMQAEFYYTDPERSMQPEWWQAEPLWVTAEHQGIRTAIHMWPGSEAHIPDTEPTYVDKWNKTETLPRKVSRVLGLLDLPGDQDVASHGATNRRPELILYYVPNIDSDGHKYGPNSTEIRKTISDVDTMLAHLFSGLRERNLTEIVNVVIVSDHGMATTSNDRLVQLEDLVDMDLVDHVDGWPLQGLRPKHPDDVAKLHKQLMKTTASNPNLEVYLRDEDMPERWHFSNNDRIAPLWIVPKAGWAIATKDDFDVELGRKEGKIYRPRGLHGYDHEHPLMRAIFVARGPSFPHKPNSRVPVFQNTEVYNIICDSLAIKPSLNNGTLRLPLKPVGLHSDGKALAEVPNDPPAKVSGKVVSSAMPAQPSRVVRPDTPDDEYEPPKNEKPDDETAKSWWTYVTEKIEEAKAWANGVIYPNAKDDD